MIYDTHDPFPPAVAPVGRPVPARAVAVSAVLRLVVLVILQWALVGRVEAQAAAAAAPAAGPAAARQILVEAILAEDVDKQIAGVQKLTDAGDPLIEQVLAAWRGGTVFLFETNDARIPVILDPQTDADGNARAIRVVDGESLKDAAGAVLKFGASDLTAADANSKLRRAIKTALDLFALGNPNPKMRRDAVLKLGQDQNQEYLPHFEALLAREKVAEVRKALQEAVGITKLGAPEVKTRLAAAQTLSDLRSINGLSLLQRLRDELTKEGSAADRELVAAVGKSIWTIENYMWWGSMFGTAFRGLSLSAVLLVAALGLAITFGLMGIINMAHGELMMVGAYAAYVTQNMFKAQFGPSGVGFDSYFLVAILVSFVAAGLVGLVLERGIIRFLYRRPLESLLATWGVSLVLQQIFRDIFGAANVQVTSPSWMSGSFVVNDVLLAYNRLFVIGFAVTIVLLTFLLLTRTSLGLQVRAVMQNRAMASCLGVRTNRVNMVTFAFGSGLAGMAGACLAQIGNVGPSLGQSYIVDCFMVVVLGGVGNLVGTIAAALGVGVTDQLLQPWLGAVMGKIMVLGAIILFLQWRPAGMFTTRSRSLEG